MHLFGELLRTTVELPDAKAHILDAIFDDRIYGPLAIDALRNCFDAMDLDTLTDHLVGGITKREVLDRIPEPRSVAFHVLAPDDFVLEPLPNHLYTRDTSAWLYGGVAINSMRKKARVRETAHYEAIYRWHPLFAGAQFAIWSAGAENGLATTEGGDMLVLGGGALLIGMSERTVPAGVERLARRLFAGGEVDRIVALRMPETRALMHLDTVMTMVDPETFTKYAGLGMLPAYTIRPGDNEKELDVTDHPPERMHSGDRRGDGPRRAAGAHRGAGRARRRAGAVGRRLQHPRRRARRRRDLRAQRHHEHVPARARHRGPRHPRRRARPGPRRPAVHELPGGARPGVTLARARKVTDLTGPGHTDRFGIGGTDLGATAVAPDGRLVSVFGDTFAERHRRRPGLAGAGGPVRRSGGRSATACGGRARPGRASPRARSCATATTACAGGAGGCAGSPPCCPPT